MNWNSMLLYHIILVKVSVWFHQVKQVVFTLLLGMKQAKFGKRDDSQESNTQYVKKCESTDAVPSAKLRSSNNRGVWDIALFKTKSINPSKKID